MPRGVIWTALLILAACGSPAATFSGVDCGTSSEGSVGYDSQARECVWNAYSSGTAVRWSVRSQTIEGDPTPQTLRFDTVLGVVVTRDMSADKFSNQADRRMWTWRCAKMTKVPWVTDPSRYSFEFSTCTGDGPATTFP
jgi:hypothetical protein